MINMKYVVKIPVFPGIFLGNPRVATRGLAVVAQKPIYFQAIGFKNGPR